ncbi:DUF6282 family protein [Virgibacillus ndiopensis]|uniref:DUF6282 family protein n=1 Tax=Virgibacillus ndiopensis TaxID=2004408 RepID=UPI000C07BC62|nr:DUF6282 family protein [Virgibacillus ndiopensis]
MESLLEGAYDLHVHTGPDVMNRKLDDLEMTERLQKVGMKGFGIKSHYFCTAERARLVNKVNSDVKAFGAISLNNAVGGINPIAVEMAARDGAKIVWMPTVDAMNEEIQFKQGKYKNPPGWAKFKQEMIDQGIETSSLTVFEDSKISNTTLDILEVIAKHNLILATGHLGRGEIFHLVKAAKDLNIKKVVITHPNFPSINLSKEEQKTLVDMGAIIEHCFTTPHTKKVTWESVFEEINYVGYENCILSSDLGQFNAIYPDEGMKIFVQKLLNNGFNPDMINTMIKENPSYLVEG